ncbi:MAG: MFS transporter [Actinomycetota bacterium]
MNTPDERRGARTRLRRIALDLTPLRASRDFRLLWAGLFVSEIGYQFTRVALYVQVYALTGTPAMVGLLGLAGLAGQVAGTLIGASFIDAHDRRRILLWSQVVLAGLAAVLLITTVTHRAPIAVLFGVNASMWFVGAIEGPARSAMTPRLIGVDLVPAALALYQVLWQTVQIVGPALAGLLIAATDPSWAYGVDMVTYGALIVAALAMRPMPPDHDTAEAAGWAAVREGFDHVKRERLLQSTFAIDLVAMIFGMPMALFPALAVTQFHRGIGVVGLLFAAPSVGALLQALAGGWTGRVRRQGEVVVWAVVGWGAAIAAFGLVGGHLVWALLFLAAAGAADVVSAIFRSTILQVTVPDRLRGRLASIFMLVVAGGPKLGDLEAGVVATVFTPTVSVVSGGVACIVGAFVCAALYPELRRYRANAADGDGRTDP